MNASDTLDLNVMDPRCYRGEAGTVVVEAQCLGMQTGAFRGIEPARRVINLGIAAILYMRDRLISKIHIYYNAGSLQRQLGIAATNITLLS